MTDERRIITAPRSVMGVVRHGSRLYTDNAGALWKILVPLAVIAQLLDVALTVAVVPAGSVVVNGTIYVPPGSSVSSVALAGALTIIVEALIGIVTFGAAVRLLATTALGRPETPGDAFTYAFRRTGPLVWLSIMYTLLVAGGGALFIIPGVYVAVALVAAIPVLLIEDLRGGVAIKRSSQLTKGRWWATLGALIPAGLVVGGIAIALSLALRVSGSIAAYALAQAASGLIIEVFLTPIWIATTVAIYIDLRARNDPERNTAPFTVDPSVPPPAAAGNPWV